MRLYHYGPCETFVHRIQELISKHIGVFGRTIIPYVVKQQVRCASVQSAYGRIQASQ